MIMDRVSTGVQKKLDFFRGLATKSISLFLQPAWLGTGIIYALASRNNT